VSYSAFIAGKLGTIASAGIDAPLRDYALFPHQADLTRWALRRGRAAIFADTGLGKMRMAIAWADAVVAHTGCPVIILCPLAVAQQFVAEGLLMGITVTHCREESDVRPGINITNYDRLHKFDMRIFSGVALDESSIIKHHASKTLALLMDAFAATPYKLCCTATPSPNDWTELGTHAEFLGVRSRSEMLAEFFAHDGGDTSVWRLKGHARAVFWRWVASWGAMIRSPADLGHDASAYELPPLHIHQHVVEIEHNQLHGLFAAEAQTLTERRQARRDSLHQRVAAVALHVKSDWYKMAEYQRTESDRGLETGVCAGEEGKGGSRPGVQEEAERARMQGQGSQEGIHGRLLQGEPGEVSRKDSGAASCVQRSEKEEVRGKRRLERRTQGDCSSMGGSESGEEVCPEAAAVRHNAGAVQADDGCPGECVRNMRILGHDRSEDVSSCGSLPRNEQGSRDSLLALQHGNREVQEQREASFVGSGVRPEAWLIWCDLNDEQDALERQFGDLAFSVRGASCEEEKEAAVAGWLRGDRPVMISKASILGWGLNFQHCANQAFVGVNDSYEGFYQAVRRSWRFGQKRTVNIHVFASNQDGAVVANIKRKQAAAEEMAAAMASETLGAVRESVLGATKDTNSYNASRSIAVPSFLVAA